MPYWTFAVTFLRSARSAWVVLGQLRLHFRGNLQRRDALAILTLSFKTYSNGVSTPPLAENGRWGLLQLVGRLADPEILVAGAIGHVEATVFATAFGDASCLHTSRGGVVDAGLVLGFWQIQSCGKDHLAPFVLGGLFGFENDACLAGIRG